MSEQFDAPKLPSRRRFLKGGLAAGLAAAIGGELSHEMSLTNGSFETVEARWYPLYERHDRHEKIIVPENIPASLEALSFEGIKKHRILLENGDEYFENMYEMPPVTLLVSSVLDGTHRTSSLIV